MSDPVEIKINDNGPILVTGGPFVVKDAKGNAWDLGGRAAIALCRCGQSNNKPFCDGSHRTCNFASAVPAGALPPKA